MHTCEKRLCQAMDVYYFKACLELIFFKLLRRHRKQKMSCLMITFEFNDTHVIHICIFNTISDNY